MKRLLSAALFILAILLVVAVALFVANRDRALKAERRAMSGRKVQFTGPPPPFCRCHSNSAPMRKMHRAFGLSDCAICHRGGDVMRKDRSTPTTAQLAHRIATTTICRQCHTHP